MTNPDKLPLPEVTPYTGTYADNVARIALDVGEGLLTNGADVHRVEIAIEKICRTYGAAHIDVFTIHSLILAAVYMPDGTHSTQSRRIFETSNNLTRLELYNALSRKLCEEKPSIDHADEEIQAIKKEGSYPFFLTLIAYVISAGSFAIFFGGTLRDGISAGLIGIITALLDRIRIDQINKMVKTMLISFVSGALSCLSVHIGIGQNLDMIIIGTIMLLIPGLSLGNAMRDLLSGDTLTGTLKSVQAIIIAVMMVLGYALALLIAGGGLK
ncbi:MAG: threonine/serine exporter family protein [Clostridia bacterium]|nr:threonine/serine exporter family protein [Clostridia bacterium]